jgi:hypothetical protein
MRRLGSHEKDILTGRLDSNQCAVFCLQKISVAQQRSSGQEEGRFSSVGESGSKPALPSEIEWQHNLWETTQFSFGYFAVGVFFDP